VQALEAELEADAEHQEDDAELGKAMSTSALSASTAKPCGPTGHADRQVAEHGRQAQATHQGNAVPTAAVSSRRITSRL
jgi:hypothetical protein